MKKFKKVLLWFFSSLVVLIIIIFIFRDNIVLLIIKNEENSKLKSPYKKLEIQPVSDSLFNVLSSDFDKYSMDPYNYVLKEFQNHDIVFLGENHRIKHDLIFVRNLIPKLYENGIHYMGFEFALNSDSMLIRKVITNKDNFDQKLANQIIFNMSPFWGYKEYIDLFRSAWEVNRNLPDSAQKFMIYGIMHDFDFSLMKKRSDEFDQEIMTRIRKGVADPEEFMANSIINTFINKNHKAFIYCGIHHAFTGYKDNGRRVGVIVKEKIGDKAFTIALHYPWQGRKKTGFKSVYPVNGSIDSFVRRYKSENCTFGINVKNTAFGELTDTMSVYCRGNKMLLKSFCDGYIYLNPFNMAEGVSIQKNFINRDNYKYAKCQLPNPELRNGILRFVGPKVLNEAAGMDADIKYQFRHLF